MSKNESVDAASMHPIVHTPGPWEFDKDNYGICNRRGFGLLDSLGESLGVTIHTSDVMHQPVKEAVANAKLIAAAPKMLELIREFHDFAEPTRHYEHAERARQAFRDAAVLLGEHGG